MCSHRYRRAILFVDNAGADIMLGAPAGQPCASPVVMTKKTPELAARTGMLPLARELLRLGTTVIIAANSLPSINDITAAELEALLPQVASLRGMPHRLQHIPSVP